MKAVSLDNWAVSKLQRFVSGKEYEIDEGLWLKYPNKWRVTSELKFVVKPQSDFEVALGAITKESTEVLNNPKKRGRPFKAK
jgi:hypothetical protein